MFSTSISNTRDQFAGDGAVLGPGGEGEAASPGIALTFLPRNASGISKQVNRGAARRNYCSGFVKFANLFGGGVSGVRNEHSTCCNRGRARHPAPQGSGCPGPPHRSSPETQSFPISYTSLARKKRFLSVQLAQRQKKKKEDGKGEKRFCYTSGLQSIRKKTRHRQPD